MNQAGGARKEENSLENFEDYKIGDGDEIKYETPAYRFIQVLSYNFSIIVGFSGGGHDSSTRPAARR